MPFPDDQTLLDDEARRTFVESLDENFCVSAGAGVGKTTAITRRIANLALHRPQGGNVLSRLVVVTYGKLAAEELRVRTRDLVLEQLDQSAHGRQTLLADLRGAFFGTIHSFCLKLIREQGSLLGLPETVELLEAHDEDALWARFCEGGAVDALDLPANLLARVTRHLSFEQLLDLARNIGPEGAGTCDVLQPDDEPPALDFAAALADDGGRSKDKTRAHQRRLQSWIAEFAGGASFLELPVYAGGSNTFLAAVAAAVEPYARWVNDAAGALAVRIARAFRDFRLEKGLMTYRDQVFWCRQLVNDPAALARLRAREYRVILDEAQDTDAEMFAILTEIARPSGAPPGTWPAQRDAPGPVPGRFSFVGDDQQAIYSERADAAVYRSYIEAFKAGRGGRHLEFSVTMRCPQRVIEFVNAVFGRGRLPQSFVEFRELSPRPRCPEGAAWRLDLGALESAEGRAGLEARLAHECRRIAVFLVTQGRVGLGIADWSEVAVIAPRVHWLETAAAIFAEHGLPGLLRSQKKIAREVARHSWPAALLHVLMHPWDRFELIGVLREIFAVSDVDLARLHRHGATCGGPGLAFWPDLPSTDPAGGRQGPIPSARLRQALELLHELRQALPIDAPGHGRAARQPTTGDDGGTLSRYVDLVLRETALGARLEIIGESSAALEGLRARALQAECAGVTLRAWVRGLVQALEQPVPPADGGRDAIQFLTCLKAKGLEWPVVIPLGLGCEIRERPHAYPRVEPGPTPAQYHFSKVTVHPHRREERRAREAEEFQRMLYVTLTRARRLLVIPDGSALYNRQMPNFCGLARWNELDLPALLDAPPAPPAEPDVFPTGATDPGPPYFEENKRRLRRAAIISQQIPRRVLPSGLVHAKPDPAPETRTDLCAPDAPGHHPDGVDDRLLVAEAAGLSKTDADEPLTGIGGIAYGNWWHAVLQRYPWKARAEDERAAYLRAQWASVPAASAWASRAADELQRFTASLARREFLAEGEVFLPEVPFAHPRHAGEWMEGIMDLVILTHGGAKLWIVDWKTDRRQPSDASEAAFLTRLAEKYAPQLQAYAEVFARGLGRPVERILLYATALGETVPVGLP